MTVQTLHSLLNMALLSFPPIALRFLPFGDKLRVKKWQVVAILAAGYLGQVAVYFWLERTVPLNFTVLQLYKFFYSFVYVAMPFLLIREKISKLAFIWFITASYINIVARLSSFLELRFFGGGVAELDFARNNLIVLCLLVATWPPMALFLTRAIAPALRAADPSVTRLIWMVPGFFMLNYTIYITDLRVEQVSNTRYILLIVPLVGGIGMSCYVLLRLLGQAAEKARLNSEVAAMNRLVEVQREQYEQIIMDEEKSRAARHDLRHQVAVIRGYLREGNLDSAMHYCDELTGAIPPVEGRYCDNFAVNAVAAHYLALAKADGVRTEVRMEVPKQTGRVPSSELCVVVGNLLENALEACRRLPPEERAMQINSRVEQGRLYITVDNRFDGKLRREGRHFLSGKRQGGGIGLSSIRTVCEKHGGVAKFEARREMFLSSVMLALRPAEAEGPARGAPPA